MGAYNDYQTLLQETKQEVDSVSPSFCAAKWQQVTIHLQTGQTHSCHHPGMHKIQLEEIKDNPSALHNTTFKKHMRKMMLEGRRPPECDYCWRAEDAPGEHFSDRVKKSADSWAKKYIPIIAKQDWDHNTLPSYVEVSFSHVCNFSCAYCQPDISSGVMQTIKKHGPVPLSDYNEHDLDYLKKIGRFPIPVREENPYVDAWWAWWPELYPALEHFRITGGEPLLSKETFRTLDWIIEHPNPNLNLAINTNLCVPDDVLKKFLSKCKTIHENKAVKSIKIFTSCDTWGPQAEYIRIGMDYKKWYQNLWNIVLEHDYLQPTLMITFGLLSIPRFKEFLTDMLSIRQSPSVKQHENGVHGLLLDFPYLRHPRYISALIADSGRIKDIEDIIQFMKDHMNTDQMFFYEGPNKITYYHNGFYRHEVDGMQRILNVIKAEDQYSEENLRARKDFYLYIKEHDARHGFNFQETFPEIAYLYDQCKQEYEESLKEKNEE